MMGRAITISAVMVYLAVMLGCVIHAPPEPRGSSEIDYTGGYELTAERKVELPLRGVGLQIHRLDWIDTKYREYIDKIRDVGANCVMFVVKAQQTTVKSDRVYLDVRATPNEEQLGRLIDYAHGRGLKAMLMFMVLPEVSTSTEDWRGRIEPKSWDAWWESYANVVWYYATIAERYKLDVLVIGTELISTEGQTQRWVDLAKRTRNWYKGMITYSANWDHYDESHIKFWKSLDLIGINSYWTLGRDRNVTVEEIVDNWREIQQPLMKLQRKVNRPVMLIEVGWCPIANAARDPWDYTRDEMDSPTDLELQRKLYEGFFRAWYGVPGFGGFNIWEWGHDSDGRGYSPEGKPAERVLREWLKKSWHPNDVARQ